MNGLVMMWTDSSLVLEMGDAISETATVTSQYLGQDNQTVIGATRCCCRRKSSISGPSLRVDAWHVVRLP